jgi:hypothetical protein
VQLGLERADLPGQHRLRDVQAGRGPAEVQLLTLLPTDAGSIATVDGGAVLVEPADRAGTPFGRIRELRGGTVDTSRKLQASKVIDATPEAIFAVLAAVTAYVPDARIGWAPRLDPSCELAEKLGEILDRIAAAVS